MGTSSSGGGPGDKTPLLPDWALPDGTDSSNGNDADGDDGDDRDDDTGNAGDSGVSEDGVTGGANTAAEPMSGVQSGQPIAAAAPGRYWSAAKRQLGSAASGGGGRNRIARACREYVRARGGSRGAARSAKSARGATARLGGFLSNVANRGIESALTGLNLNQFIGRDAHEVFAAIVDALAPEGADLEQSATRHAIEKTLAGLFEQYIGPDGNIAALEAMTPDAIRTAVEASVAASIFSRWLGDLARRLEEKAVTAVQAVKLERDLESYIRDTVKLDLKDQDPLTMKWEDAEGSEFVERIYQEAYSILGGQR